MEAGRHDPERIRPGRALSVSQGTVRKAIDELATDNLLVRRQGKGTFVATHAEQHIQYRFLRLLPDAGIAGAQGPAERRIIECRRLRAPAEVARQLALRTGDPAAPGQARAGFRRHTGHPGRHLAARRPVQGPDAETLAGDKGPMYALFETQFGVRMVRAVEKIKAVGADADAAALLACEVGHPLLSVERLAYTYNDVPMELRRGLYRTEIRHYHNELS